MIPRLLINKSCKVFNLRTNTTMVSINVVVDDAVITNDKNEPLSISLLNEKHNDEMPDTEKVENELHNELALNDEDTIHNTQI